MKQVIVEIYGSYEKEKGHLHGQFTGGKLFWVWVEGFLYPTTQKVVGYYVLPSRKF